MFSSRSEVVVKDEKLNMNIHSKIFFATLGAWLTGKPTNTKLRGTRAEIEAIFAALTTTKEFQDELHNPSATVDSVISKLGAKHNAASNFEHALGIVWPL